MKEFFNNHPGALKAGIGTLAFFGVAFLLIHAMN
jgi:hypothetical protein